jgi:hypothetical protein
MAVSTKDSDSQAYDILTTDPNKDQRRIAALSIFRDYLVPDHGILAMQRMGYSDGQIRYISEAVDHLALRHTPTNKGLEGRSERENGSASRPSLVDSSAVGVGEFILGLPTRLNWIARNSMTDQESSDLESMGSLMTITAVAPSLLVEDYDDRLAKILHGRDQFPGIGLQLKSFLTIAARRVGYGATFTVERVNDAADIQINLQRPGTKAVIETWRDLPTNNTGLHFFGRVPLS